MSVAATYVVEIGLPPLFLLPFAHLRRIAAYAQVTPPLQYRVGIKFTGLDEHPVPSTLLLDAFDPFDSEWGLDRSCSW